MKIRRFFLVGLTVLLMFAGCVKYRTPYLELDVRSVYNTSDIKINYTYVCEYRDQRCVYSLWNRYDASEMIDGYDAVLPSSGTIDLTDLNLGEGDYRLDFDVYTETDGEYTLLKFLSDSWDFTIDLP